MTLPLLKWLTFLLGSLTVTLRVLLYWICFFVLALVHLFYNGFSSIGKFWSCYFSFHWLSIKQKMDAPFHRICSSLWLFSYRLGQSSWSFERAHGRISSCYVPKMGLNLYDLFVTTFPYSIQSLTIKKKKKKCSTLQLTSHDFYT